VERKTKIDAQEGRQDLFITREFELPVDLLFKAYVEADLVEQWMTTKVVKMESKKHGSYQFESTDYKGNRFGMNGAIHDIIPNKKITRTFEMEGTPYGIQLEVYQFEELTDDTSKLTMHVIYESGEQRDEVLKLPFAQGINMAHQRLEDTFKKSK